MSEPLLTTLSGLPDKPPRASSIRAENFIASPRGVLVLVPLLVLLVGVALTIVGQTALGGTSRVLTAKRFSLQTDSAGRRIGDALNQADPVLDRLTVLASDQLTLPKNPDAAQLRSVALELRDLVAGRPGITQAYIALPDGRFLSADASEMDTATTSSAGLVEFQLTEGGRSRSFAFKKQALVPVEDSASDYDPRNRDWYKLALAEKERSWSSPYAFYFSGTPGVTQVDVLLGLDGQVEAVVGVDFDVKTLTRFMAGLETRDVRSAVFTKDGVVLAYPFAADAIEALPRRQDVPTHRDLKDPVLTGLLDHLGATKFEQVGGGHARELELIRYQAAGQQMLATVSRFDQSGPRWFVATISSEDSAYESLFQYRNSSLLIGGIAMVIALLMSWALARHILRVRAAATEAQAAAQKAQAQALDLGSYRLLSKLGQGGMGEVWRARHRLLAREAAIKLIKTDGEQPPHKQKEMQERFRREARAIAALRSRNTIEMFDYGLTADGTLYYVMELLEGIDLQTLVEEHGVIPAERVRLILLQACNSLGEAHSAGLVHRDIKPANLFLCRAADEVDVLKVLDFGLVLTPVEERLEKPETRELALERLNRQMAPEDLARLTEADMQLGTPGFMSPEQALGVSTDSRADIYALGCVAWWLLTGKLLFSAETPLGMMLKHIQAPVADLREQVIGPLSPELEGLIRRCLEKKPEDRPQTAAELAQDLRRIGPERGEWNEVSCRQWWDDKLPAPPPVQANLSMPPRTDIAVVQGGT